MAHYAWSRRRLLGADGRLAREIRAGLDRTASVHP